MNKILSIWMMKRLSYEVHAIKQALYSPPYSRCKRGRFSLQRQMSRFVCWVAQLIISFMLFWLLVSLRDNHCEVLCHLVDISGEEHMVDSKEQTPLSSSTAGYWTARGGGTRDVSCYDLQHATTEWWMSTPQKKSQGVLAFIKAGCNAKNIFLVRIFVLFSSTNV